MKPKPRRARSVEIAKAVNDLIAAAYNHGLANEYGGEEEAKANVERSREALLGIVRGKPKEPQS